jgi:hypothetical protein
MQTNKQPMMGAGESILTQRGSDEKVIALLAERELQPEHFYLTGFETISFNQNRSFAIETVLSSSVTFYNEVLIVNTGIRSFYIAQLCEKHHITCHVITIEDLIDPTILIEKVIRPNRAISHMIVCEGDNHSITRDELKMAGFITGKNKIDLIVECAILSISVPQALDCGVSFLVSPDPCCDDHSLIVARRSRLVQCEGRSRLMYYDLYKYWQQTVAHRRHEIEPMAV